MKKNILLHGATNFESSNYGDFIYGEMIYNYLLQNNEKINVRFFQPSNFFNKFLKNSNNNQKFSVFKTDALIYIPGGYFGEGHNARFRDNLVQFLRFLPVGLFAVLKKIPIVVLGIGAGPNNNFLMNFGISNIVNNSLVVTARDRESFEALKKLSSNPKIVECFDMILSNEYNTSFESEQLSSILDKVGDKKILLVHYNHSQEALFKFAESVKKFVEVNNDYQIVVTSDSLLSFEDEFFSKFSQMVQKEVLLFKYEDPNELTKLIHMSSLILTCKLHLGVIGCLFNKSVVVAACHPEKTNRFYRDINQPDRSFSLFDASSTEIYQSLEKFKNDCVRIPENCFINSRISWQMLADFLGNFS
ncbi:TPA: polysaccharide pyruvyl transferase family protein [Streptococcus suis]|uniref:Glycosyl transferase n=1 Tax=Streptococcus suis TaxID=1307 RepID=A0A1P8VRB9_STRSU|nr:Glycosyl transferase [Streptococcus suis]APZ79266.1 Glycosyl transferase [Streptococcus suis]HEM2786810.1 polysaccharide pyruvyl transferase family protein [Streptococcus suis]